MKNIAAIDIGNSITKAVVGNKFFAFPSVIATAARDRDLVNAFNRPPEEFQDVVSNMKIRYENEFFYIGAAASNRSAKTLFREQNKLAQKTGRAIVLASIAATMYHNGVNTLDVVVETGLPIKDFNNQGLMESYRNSIVRTHEVEYFEPFTNSAKKMTINVTDAVIQPQCMGFLFDMMYSYNEGKLGLSKNFETFKNKKNLLIDIGWGTTDVLDFSVTESGAVYTNEAVSFDKGMKSVGNELRRTMIDYYKLNHPNDVPDIEQSEMPMVILRGEYSSPVENYKINIVEENKRLISEVKNEVIQALNLNNKIETKYDNIIMAGGGGVNTFPYVGDAGSYKLIEQFGEDDSITVFGNSRGFMKHCTRELSALKEKKQEAKAQVVV